MWSSWTVHAFCCDVKAQRATQGNLSRLLNVGASSETRITCDVQKGAAASPALGAKRPSARGPKPRNKAKARAVHVLLLYMLFILPYLTT